MTHITSPVALVVAMDQNRGIGLKGELPWKTISADLRRFKNLTWGKVAVVGRFTFESIQRRLGGPLVGRRNLIISSNPHTYNAPGCFSATSFEKGMQLADSLSNDQEIMVIGGAQIYAQALPFASRIYLTQIEEKFEADTFFPYFNENEWETIGKEDKVFDQKNDCWYKFLTLERRRGDATVS